MLKSIKKIIPYVAWFFVICATLVSLYDFLVTNVMPFTSILKFWIFTAIFFIIALFVTGELKFGEVKEKASEKADELGLSKYADTIYKVIYFILVLIAVLMFLTLLAVKFHWNNIITYWIAMHFNEFWWFVGSVAATIVVYFIEKKTR